MDTILVLRMIERLLCVVVGGGAIYLGFRLFMAIPHISHGEGKFTFPGGSVHLLRTGPGVFFALFGCAIVYWSFSHSVTMDNLNGKVFTGSGTPSLDTTKRAGTRFIGLSEDQNKLRIWVENLNRMDRYVQGEGKRPDKVESKNTISQVKLLIIRGMLENPNDPDFAEFSLRIRTNPAQEFGAKWQKWADFYNSI
jgi:hypothetical protein